MNTIHINNNYFIKYGIKNEKQRQIYLYYLASVNKEEPQAYRKRCFWTLIDDTRYGKREPHFLIEEVFWLLRKALENPLNYSQSGSMTPKMVIQKKCQILWIFTHICGREFTQNLVEKFFEISSVDILEEENQIVWQDSKEQNIWMKPLVEDKVACLDGPEPMEVEEPIHYEGISYVEMDGPIGYLEEINWINYGEEESYEVASIENQLDEIEKEEMERTQKLYTPHRDVLIFTTLEPSSKIEIMYYQEEGDEGAPTPKFDLGWIEPDVEIVYQPQDYDKMEEPLTKLQSSMSVEIYPGYNCKFQDNLFRIDGVMWQKHPEKGWICVDKKLTESAMFSIRDFRYTDHPDYHLLTELTNMVE